MENQEEQFKQIAAQLRKPDGEWGIETAKQMNINNRLMNELGIAALKLSENDAVLETGMGNGFFVKDILAAAPGITYTGCDYSETMVQESEDLNAEHIAAGKAKFLLTNAHTLPFPPDTFTKALTVNTIYFMDEPVNELTELHRVLKPGGTIAVVIRPRSSMEVLPFVKHGFTTYEKEEVELLLAKSGFSTISSEETLEGEKEFSGIKLNFKTAVITGTK